MVNKIRTSSTQTTRSLTVFFDGSCPICSKEIIFYKMRAGADELSWVDVSDEFGVESAFFRISGTNESVVFEGNATSGNGIRWTIFFDIPGHASLGLHDLFVMITDIDGLMDYANESEILEVVDSPSIWYGIHIQNADDPSWAGDSILPSGTPFGMYRGVPTPVRACVEDVD